MLVAVLTAFCCSVAGYFCWATLGFSIALTKVPVTAEWLTPFGIAVVCGLGVLVLGVFTLLRRRLEPSSKRLLISVVLSLIIGLVWANSAHNQFIQGRVQTARTLEMQGMIVGLPELNEEKVTFLFRTRNAENTTEDIRKALLRVTWRHPNKALEPGQVWSFPLRLKPSDSLNVSGIAYVRKGEGEPEQLGVEPTYHSIRFQLKQRLLLFVSKHDFSKPGPEVLFQSTRLKALLLALLLGDRSLLTPKDWQLLSDTGTTHLIAISGLHIGLVASFAYLLTLYTIRLLRVGNVGSTLISGFHIAHLVALFAAWVYGALAGYSVPTQRACLTVTVVVMLRLVYPIINPWLAVLVSASVVLLFDPIAILNASFWLTFAAVAFIFFVLQGRVGRLPVLSSWTRVQLALFVGLFPLSVGYFGKVSLVSIFANLVAVPVVGWLVVPLAFFYVALICCGTYFETMTSGVIELLDRVVAVLMLFLEEVQSWGGTLLFPQTSIAVVWVSILGAAVLCLPRAVPGKKVAFLMFLPLFSPLLTLDGRGGLESEIFIDVLPSSSALMVIDQGGALVLIGSSDIPAYKIQYQFSRYLQRKGVKNELNEPVFSIYRQWVSEEYFVLNIRLQSRPFMQWAAVGVDSLPVCTDRVIKVKSVSIESLIGGGRCQFLLSGDRGRYLVVRPKNIQQQLIFLERHKPSLLNRDIMGLLVAVKSKRGASSRSDLQLAKPLLSGALLNTVNPEMVVFLGGGLPTGASKGKFDEESLGRLIAREIKIKTPDSHGMLLKL